MRLDNSVVKGLSYVVSDHGFDHVSFRDFLRTDTIISQISQKGRS